VSLAAGSFMRRALRGRGRARAEPIEPGSPQRLGVVSQGVRDRDARRRSPRELDASSWLRDAATRVRFRS
jgi:hypothetical protein